MLWGTFSLCCQPGPVPVDTRVPLRDSGLQLAVPVDTICRNHHHHYYYHCHYHVFYGPLCMYMNIYKCLSSVVCLHWTVCKNRNTNQVILLTILLVELFTVMYTAIWSPLRQWHWEDMCRRLLQQGPWRHPHHHELCCHFSQPSGAFYAACKLCEA